jgi:hypothetical protein
MAALEWSYWDDPPTDDPGAASLPLSGGSDSSVPRTQSCPRRPFSADPVFHSREQRWQVSTPCCRSTRISHRVSSGSSRRGSNQTSTIPSHVSAHPRPLCPGLSCVHIELYDTGVP